VRTSPGYQHIVIRRQTSTDTVIREYAVGQWHVNRQRHSYADATEVLEPPYNPPIQRDIPLGFEESTRNTMLDGMEKSVSPVHAYEEDTWPCAHEAQASVLPRAQGKAPVPAKAPRGHKTGKGKVPTPAEKEPQKTFRYTPPAPKADDHYMDANEAKAYKQLQARMANGLQKVRRESPMSLDALRKQIWHEAHVEWGKEERSSQPYHARLFHPLMMDTYSVARVYNPDNQPIPVDTDGDQGNNAYWDTYHITMTRHGRTAQALYPLREFWARSLAGTEKAAADVIPTAA